MIIVKSYQHNGYDRQKLLAIARRTVTEGTEGQFPGVRFDTEGVGGGQVLEVTPVFCCFDF